MQPGSPGQLDAAVQLVLCEPHLLTQSSASLRAKLVAVSELLDASLLTAKQVRVRVCVGGGAVQLMVHSA